MTTIASLLHLRKRHRDASSHFHGPQRRRRLCPGAFRYPFFASPSIPPEAGFPGFDMGNFVSGLLGLRPREEGLVLYKGWVDAQDLKTATRDDAELRPLAVNRRLGDARKAALEAAPHPRVKRKPYYKEAHEKARSHDKRLGELVLQVNLEEEKLAELRKSAEAPKEDFSELFIPLTAEEENVVHECLYGRGSSGEVLALHKPSNIEVSREKFRCLRPRAWLNDEVINLYLELLKEREKREPKRFLKCHFFNTFFYKKVRS